jgi:cytochrome d ubiquinol oxidase subunit II
LLFSTKATDLYANYLEHPMLFIVIALTVCGLVGIKVFLQKQSYFKAWFSSALTIAGATFFGVIGIFPNLLPSSINAEFSLTAFNASSSALTLKIMLMVVLLFIPVVLVYQIWTYNLFKGKVTQQDLDLEEAY